MKRILTISFLGLLIVLGSSVANKASAQFRDDVTYQDFYDDLSPYGQWIDYPEYGYVWSPDAGQDFRPYSSGGHWVWSDDYEWIWVSDYDWGWAPFHYGRWFNDPSYGWLWVPGYEWAPAWVVWRSGGDYYGWAPLRPGININVNFSFDNYNDSYDNWCFAPRRYITSPRIYDYCIDRRQNYNIFNNTVIINNYNYSRNVFLTGPRRNEAEIYTGGRINSVRFRPASRPGRSEFRNNEVGIYRPNVQRGDERRFAPQRFEQYNRQRQGVDNRVGRNDNSFRRNGNEVRRDVDVNNRGNNLPQNREQNNNSGPGFERRNNNINNEVRQPQNNDGRNEQGRGNSFERNNGNNNRGFRNDNVPTSRQPQSEVRQPQIEQRRPQEQPRNFDRRGDNNPNFRNENVPIRQPQREFRNENRVQQQSPAPQAEQRRPQEQPRQFESRNNNSPNQGNGDNGNGRGHGRRRD